MLAATDAYRAESDELAPFFEEYLTVDPNVQVQAGPLYGAYKAWAESNDLPERERLSAIKFGRKLVERGYDKYVDKSTGKSFYTGLEVREQA